MSGEERSRSYERKATTWSGSWDQDPGDEEILARALQESRVLVTLDKDFGELAVLKSLPHSGIIPLAGLSAKSQARVCAHALARYGEQLQAGAIVTAEAGRLRIRSKDTPV